MKIEVSKASELEYNRKGWRVTAYTPGELFDEQGTWFRTKRQATKYASLVKNGVSPYEAKYKTLVMYP